MGEKKRAYQIQDELPLANKATNFIFRLFFKLFDHPIVEGQISDVALAL